LLLILGLLVLLGSGGFLVRGATELARALGVSALVIGLTVVAFGTSAPELAVNVSAALKGESGITFGNVVGSNIANIGLIIGLTAIITLIRVHRTIVTREIPVMLLATAGMILLASDSLLRGAPDVIGRLDGVLLLCGFGAFLFVTTRSALRDRKEDRLIREAEQKQDVRKPMHWAAAVGLTVVGLVGVLLGSHWTVEGATGVAEALGLSQAVIGLTIVAVGTSLPELTTSVAAAWKGHPDLALGGIVGSNVFNLLFILGASASVRAVPVPTHGRADLAAMALFSVALLPLAVSQRKIGRPEGFLLLFGYSAYMAWRFFMTGGVQP